jgi:hypothetical protein
VIVQTPEHEGGPAFVVNQTDHTAFAGELARHFGNERFARLEPAGPVLELVSWHDEGWTDLDDRVLQDPDTGLPYHLVRTPLDELVVTSGLSPVRNEARHPFCGLLSSMHTYGLYNGRYGMSDFIFVDAIPAESRPRVDAMLAAELARQERLTDELRSDPATAPLADEALIMQVYKALQFFDTFSLYVQCEHPSRHGEAAFPNVPVDRDPANDVTISVTPLGGSRYRLDPFPFDVDPFEPATTGRYLDPQPAGADLVAVWAEAPPAQQSVALTA